MMKKALVYISNAKEVMKSRLTNQNGMELLQMVIIIGIAVALGAALYAVLNAFFPDFFANLTEQLQNLTDTGNYGG